MRFEFDVFGQSDTCVSFQSHNYHQSSFDLNSTPRAKFKFAILHYRNRSWHSQPGWFLQYLRLRPLILRLARLGHFHVLRRKGRQFPFFGYIRRWSCNIPVSTRQIQKLIHNFSGHVIRNRDDSFNTFASGLSFTYSADSDISTCSENRQDNVSSRIHGKLRANE